MIPPHDWVAGGNTNGLAFVVSVSGEAIAAGGFHRTVEWDDGIGTDIGQH